MSAVNTMIHHRYGPPKMENYGLSDVGSIVASEMFGEDDAFDPEDIPEFDDEPLFAPQTNQPNSMVPPSIQAAVSSFLAQVKNAVPYALAYDIRGGRDTVGNRYAQVTIDAHDPHGFIASTAAWALQAAGANDVSVSAAPNPNKPNQVVLIFSQGPVPTRGKTTK